MELFTMEKRNREGLIKGRRQDLDKGISDLHLIYAVALYITGKKIYRFGRAIYWSG